MNRDNKAFTLVEILIVLTLFGLIFGLIAFSFHNMVKNSINLVDLGEDIKSKARLFWDIQRAILSAKDMYIEEDGENSRLYLVTAGGLFEEGVVKAVFFVEEGFLKYEEFPYYYGDIRYTGEGKIYNLARVKEFRVEAYNGRRRLTNFKGIPEFVLIRINGQEFTVIPIK